MLEIEPLRVPRSVQTGDYISIDAGLVEEERPKGLPRVEVPPGSWAVWVFLREPNSFIQVVANAARFEWLE
jgi:hypothetical protein